MKTNNMTEIKIDQLVTVTGGYVDAVGPVTYPYKAVGPVNYPYKAEIKSCDPALGETGPLKETGPLGETGPLKGTGPLEYPYKAVDYPYSTTVGWYDRTAVGWYD